MRLDEDLDVAGPETQRPTAEANRGQTPAACQGVDLITSEAVELCDLVGVQKVTLHLCSTPSGSPSRATTVPVRCR